MQRRAGQTPGPGTYVPPSDFGYVMLSPKEISAIAHRATMRIYSRKPGTIMKTANKSMFNPKKGSRVFAQSNFSPTSSTTINSK